MGGRVEFVNVEERLLRTLELENRDEEGTLAEEIGVRDEAAIRLEVLDGDGDEDEDDGDGDGDGDATGRRGEEF